jgi:protein-tyrosine phosphatase
LLIGVSVLTTWQHHFIDVPTGLWLGLFCLILFPEQGRIALRPLTRSRLRLALYYLGGALLLMALSVWLGGLGGLLLWPAAALGLAMLVYLAGEPALFGKQQGRFSSAAWWLYAPYLAGAWLNSRIWTRRHPQPDLIVDGVWLGRLPSRYDLAAGAVPSLVDVCAELSVQTAHLTAYRAVPMLDMIVPEVAQIERAAQAISDLQARRPTLVCCALGYSRSAVAVAAWLIKSQRAASVAEAIEKIQAARPQIVLSAAHRQQLQEWMDDQ